MYGFLHDRTEWACRPYRIVESFGENMENIFILFFKNNPISIIKEESIVYWLF